MDCKCYGLLYRKGNSVKETFYSLEMQRDEKLRNYSFLYASVKSHKPHFPLLNSLKDVWYTPEIEKNLYGRRPCHSYQIHIRTASYAREILPWPLSIK